MSVEAGPGGYRNYNYNFSADYSSHRTRSVAPAYNTESGADTSEQLKYKDQYQRPDRAGGR